MTVTRAGAGTAGTPYVYTLTYDVQLGNVPQLTSAIESTLAGGTSPSITIATTTDGGTWYNPRDPQCFADRF